MHQKGHIVVVEPDELIRQLLETWLSEVGYRVSGTGDLAIVDDLRCVTTFVSHPARGRARAALITVLLMREYVSIMVARRAREAGADDVLRKTLTARTLAKSLAHALQSMPRRTRSRVNGGINV